MTGVPKEKVSVTLDGVVLAAADSDAKAAGLDRSELIEQALRHEHLRIVLENYTTHIAPALKIDDYAQQVYQENQVAGLSYDQATSCSAVMPRKFARTKDVPLCLSGKAKTFIP